MRARNERHLDALLSGLARPLPPHFETFAKGLTVAAPDKPPAEFTWREYAIFLLTIAAQIEHSLMVQYLYAAYSLGGPQVPEGRRDQVAAWRQVILGIAKEEMGHLATVQNTLRFLGAPLALDREDYPWDSTLAPYPFVLEPVSRASLAKYVMAESPKVWPSGVSKSERAEIEKLAAGSDGRRKINRVGELFDALNDILADETRIPSSAFHPDTYPQQASWDEWGRGYGKGARGSSLAGTTRTPDVLVIRMANRTDALAALKAVAEQGEAPGEAAAADNEASHFSRFLEVFRAFPKDETWEPTLPLPTNPVAPGLAAGDSQTAITDPEAGLWANIFNLRYRMLLSYLAHTYSMPASQDPTDLGDRRGVIINRMFGEMYNLRAISSLLVHLPLKADGAGRCGPTFQMPYTLQLPASEAGYWTLHLDLIAATANLLTEAMNSVGERADYAAALASLDGTAAAEFALYAAADDVRTGAHHMTGTIE